MIRKILYLFFALTILSCSKNVNSVQETDKKWTFKMEKTSCLGSCPVYKFTIESNGNVEYNGGEYSPVKGARSFKLSKKETRKVFNHIEDSNFFDFEDKYYENINDLPTSYLYYNNGFLEKKIMNYYGAPEELKELERVLEGIVFSKL